MVLSIFFEKIFLQFSGSLINTELGQKPSDGDDFAFLVDELLVLQNCFLTNLKTWIFFLNKINRKIDGIPNF
jgi:hypothetical protein